MALRSAPFEGIPIAVLTLVLAGTQPAMANNIAAEREQLAALMRQLELADLLAAQATRTAPDAPARYHFDYPRFRADLQRVRTGLKDYLTPQRAQPSDPSPLSGEYTREQRDRPTGTEGKSP